MTGFIDTKIPITKDLTWHPTMSLMAIGIGWIFLVAFAQMSKQMMSISPYTQGYEIFAIIGIWFTAFSMGFRKPTKAGKK